MKFVITITHNALLHENHVITACGGDAGKTHTMLGHDLWALASADDGDDVEGPPTGASSDRGVIPRAMQFLFQRLIDEAAKVMMMLMLIKSVRMIMMMTIMMMIMMIMTWRGPPLARRRVVASSPGPCSSSSND
jgi:hypothetical protein